jgi:hypothetical protein
MSQKIYCNTPGEIELFHCRDYWNESNNLSDNINLAMSPHSEVYYSSLCPIFSYELNNVQSLSLFGSVLLRDGVAFLLDFFIKNRYPGKLRTKIIVDYRLKDIVPETWHNHTAYFLYKSHLTASKNSLFYFMDIAQDFSLDFKQDKAKEIEDFCKKGIKKITIIPTIFSDLGEKDRGFIPVQLANVVQLLTYKFQDLEFSFSPLESLEPREVQGSYFSLSREMLVWVANSYVSQWMLSKGAVELYPGNISFRPTQTFSQSLNHDVTIFEDQRKSELSLKIWQWIDSLGVRSARNVDQISGGLEEFLSKDIKTLAFHFVGSRKNHDQLIRILE